ncbi:hypothetical protein BGX29_004433, partial [Mortierella sp. GBA35]
YQTCTNLSLFCLSSVSPSLLVPISKHIAMVIALVAPRTILCPMAKISIDGIPALAVSRSQMMITATLLSRSQDGQEIQMLTVRAEDLPSALLPLARVNGPRLQDLLPACKLHPGTN